MSLLKPTEGKGAEFDKYSWGQSDDELYVYVKVPGGTKSKAVKLDVGYQKLKLAVLGDVILDAPLYQPVRADDCTFGIEDQGEGRLVTVTLIKREKTNNNRSWPFICEGEPPIDVESLGLSYETFDSANQEDRASLMQDLEDAGMSPSDMMKNSEGKSQEELMREAGMMMG
jgi:hypothetical protein